MTSKAEPSDPPNAACVVVNWTFIDGYNYVTFTANTRTAVFVFVGLS